MTASMLKPAPFSRSRSSGSSTSSSSTFSDITSSISDSSSSKTNAFFASPFSTQPPSPIQPEKRAAPPPTHSLTADFFATPLGPPSPPTTTTTTAKKQRTIHLSRLFPSRYTSTVERSPDFVSLDPTSSPKSHERSPSSSSDSSFTSFVETRLPTPPPSVLPFTTIRGPDFESSSSEPTPRPSDLEPALLRFERSLLFSAQEKKLQRDHSPQPEPESEFVSDDDREVEEEPHSGGIISLNTEKNHHPISRLSLSPPALTFENPSPQDDCGTSTPTSESSSKALKSGQFYSFIFQNFQLKPSF